MRPPSPGRLACLSVLALGLVSMACMDEAFGPGAQGAVSLHVSVVLPPTTPAAWAPDGESLHVVVRRAGRVEPVVDTSVIIAGVASMSLEVPLSQAVERFVASAEVKYGASVLFLGFDVVQLRVETDTAVTLVAQYVGPGAGAATYSLAARDSSLAPGDTASLVPQVLDDLGQSIPNVPVRYVASRPALIDVDTTGLLSASAGPSDTARVTGYLPMGLSSDLVISLGTVVTQPGRAKTWTGGAPGEPAMWANAANWSPAGVPATGDTVVIEATANDPVFTGIDTVAAITITGGTLVMTNGRLLVSEDFRTEGGATGGALSMTSPQDTLRVIGRATFGGRAAGDDLAAGVLRVGGDFDAPQAGGTHGFSAGTGHRTVLDGSQPQRLWFGGGDAGAHFGDLEIANTSGGVRIGLEHQIHVTGKLRITSPVTIDDGNGGNGDVQLEVEDSLVMAAGSRLTVVELTLGGGMAVAGEFAPQAGGSFRVRFNGTAQRIQSGLDYRDVEVNDDAMLTGPTTFDGALDVTGTLDLAGHALVLTGSLHTHNGEGRLLMRNALDRLEVRGDAIFEGDTIAGDLTDGVLRVAGTFDQLRYSNKRRTFRASGNHRTILDGSGSQAMRLADPTGFGHLEIATQGGPLAIAASNRLLVERTFRISTAIDVAGVGSEGGFALDVGDSTILAVDSRLEVGLLRVRGALVVGGTLDASNVEFAGIDQEIPPAISYRALTVTGDVRLSGRTVATESIWLHGPLATLTLNGRTLQVPRLFVGNGFGEPIENTTLVMQQGADSLIIAEDASFSSAMTAGSLTAGVLVVNGGFFQSGTPQAFQASGMHKTVLTGPPGSSISFDHPGTGANEAAFRHLEIGSQADLFLRTNAVASGTLSGGGTPAAFIRSGTGASLSVGGVDVNAMTFENVRLVVNGTPTRLDNVTFSALDAAATQLAIVHPGAATAFRLTGVRFLVTPTTGAYISATDSAPLDGLPLRIEMVASTPSDGAAHTVTSGGAVVDWVGFTNGTFSPVGSMDVARFSAAAALLNDGRVLIAGGRPTLSVGSITASANIFSPVSNTFATTGDLRRPRRAFEMTTLTDGRVLVVGGGNTTHTEHFTEIYDPAAGTFTLGDTLGSNPGCRGRYTHTSTRLVDGRVLIVGGDGVTTPNLSSTCFPLVAQLFDPATNTLIATGALPAGRSRHTATLLADGRVLLVAGISTAAQIATAETYDPGSGSFAPTGSMAEGRYFHTATRLNDGRVLVVGGETGASLSSSELYDPATGTFSTTGSLSVARSRHLAVLLADGRVLIAGGRATNGGVLDSVEIYDPATGTFSLATPMTSPRFWATAVRMADGRILMAGGTDNGTSGLLSAEVYTP